MSMQAAIGSLALNHSIVEMPLGPADMAILAYLVGGYLTMDLLRA